MSLLCYCFYPLKIYLIDNIVQFTPQFEDNLYSILLHIVYAYVLYRSVIIKLFKKEVNKFFFILDTSSYAYIRDILTFKVRTISLDLYIN